MSNRYSPIKADAKNRYNPVSSVNIGDAKPVVPAQAGPRVNATTGEKDQYGLPVSYLSAAKPSKTTSPAAPKESFLSKAAKVVLPKAAEDFFGLNETPQQKQIKKDITESYANKFGLQDLKTLQSEIDPATGKLPVKKASDVRKSTPVEKYLPFVGALPSIKESLALYQSAKRLESGENTAEDDYRLARFRAESERDSTFGAKVASVLTEIPSFAGELLLTGGIYTAGKAATEKAVTKLLATAAEKAVKKQTAKRLFTKAVGNIAGGTLQTLPARFGEITAGTIQNMTPEYQYKPGEDKTFSAFISKPGDDLLKAAAKSFSNQWVEVVSEHSGGIFNEIAAPIKNKILKIGIFNTLLKNNPTLTSSKFMKLVDSAGWNGIIGEMGEERIGELMRGLLTQVGLSEDGFVFPSKEQLALELVSFAIPGVIIGAANKSLQGSSFKGEQANPPTETPPAGFPAPQQGAGEAISPTATPVATPEVTTPPAAIAATETAPLPATPIATADVAPIASTPTVAREIAPSSIDQNVAGQPLAGEGVGQGAMSSITQADISPEAIAIQQKLGPGYQKFAKGIDKMVVSGTILPEDATILRTLFENTDDKYLGSLNLSENPRMSALGRFKMQINSYTREPLFSSNKLEMQKGLASKGFSNADAEAAKVFMHEFGHASWYMVLTEEERNIVNRVYNQLGREGRRSFFRSGLSAPGEGVSANYYAKNVKEFFAESFAGYVMENKVPAAQMKPLLQRITTRFYEGLKRLVTRGEVKAVARLRPIFEKALSGDTVTPLSELMSREPVSYKQELQRMFEGLPKAEAPTAPPSEIGHPFPTKKVPVETLLPPEVASPIDEFKAPLLPELEIPTIEKVIEGEKRTPLSERVRWVDYLRTPWKVFERMGIRPNYQLLLKGYEAYTAELPKNIDKITAWSKEVPKESNERIFRSLDGETIELTPQESKVAGEIKDWLKSWADRLGMSPDRRISDYITHIFPFGKGGEIPEEIAFLINKKIPGSVYNPFLLQRQGAEGYLKDTWKALDAYVKRATRKVNMDPALAELKVASSKLTDTSQLNYLNSYIGAVNLRPSTLDTLIDNHIKEKFGYLFGARPTASITRFVRKTIARAKIGGSIVSFAKNLTQGVNTFAELGSFYTTKGYIDLVRFGGKELKENGVLIAPFIEDRTYSAIKKAAEKFDNVLFVNMNASELVNRGAAYYGAKSKFINGKIKPKEFKNNLGREMPEGYTPTMEDAIEYGKAVAAKTQFLFGPLDTPVGLNSDLARTFAQFQTFGLKQQEFIWGMVGQREWMKLTRYLVSSMLLFAWIGSAFGMKWDDSFKTLRFGMPPAMQFVVDIWGAVTGAKDQYGNKPSGAARARTIGSSLFTNIVPAGAQIKRGYEGFQAVDQGASRSNPSKTNPKGVFQYKVEQTPMNYIRGTLFGKFNLPESKAYYKKKDGAKSKQSSSNRYNPI